MVDYIASLKADLVEQFRGKANIEALVEVVGEELQQVYDFFQELRNDRDVYTAVGKQLDGVGNIVDLTRMEAGKLAGDPIPHDILDDETYRQYLIYKILKNTTDCTYPDIIKALRMFWDKPLYYREDPEIPATMIFETDPLPPEDNAAQLLTAPFIKAAGVGIKMIAVTETPEAVTEALVDGVGGRGYMLTTLPEIIEDHGFVDTVWFIAASQSFTTTRLPEIKDNVSVSCPAVLGVGVLGEMVLGVQAAGSPDDSMEDKVAVLGDAELGNMIIGNGGK